MSLNDLIKQQLIEQKKMSFAAFMQLALYHPYYGYYSKPRPKFGKPGDFITAPELTPLFAQALAHQCQPVLNRVNAPKLLEFGAGSGRLCIDLLTALAACDALPETYFILEVSGALRQQQQQLIETEIPDLAPRVTWLDRWPQQPFNGVMIANEVLDAMAVHRFSQQQSGINESFITLDVHDKLIETWQPTTDLRLSAYLDHALPKTLYPYYAEANLFIDGWLKQCFGCLTQGVVIIIDYGFPRHEFYHADRNQGTLMCHYRHQSQANPLINIGEQDITAHVDFTHVAEAAVQAGFDVAGFTNQAAFLLANQLLNFLADITDQKQAIAAQQAVKKLTLPSEMGELFKVMALTKNLNIDLTGFQTFDKRASL